MKVTIVTVYSNATVVDDVEELIFEVSEAEPEVYTELSIQRFNGGLSAEWFGPGGFGTAVPVRAITRRRCSSSAQSSPRSRPRWATPRFF